MQVIVAIEPRSYRQVIGRVLQALRPHTEVIVLDPDMLRAGIARLDPDLVFANCPDTFSPTGRPAWVQFRPYEEPPAQVCLGGQRWELEEVELDDLLSIVDETEDLTRTTRALGNC